MSGFDLIQNPDGADFQAQATLAFIRHLIGGGIEESWNDEWKRYTAEIRVARYDNCREQGYVIFMRSRNRNEQINIAFYEHRNSDKLCAVVSNARTLNAPRLEDISNAMKGKYDVAFSVEYGKAELMADWVVNQLKAFWTETDKPK